MSDEMLVAAQAFVAPYEYICEDLLQTIAAGAIPTSLMLKSGPPSLNIDPHIAESILAFRAAIAKDGGIPCQAYPDGSCDYAYCPQTRDGEPERSLRTCPLLGADNDRSNDSQSRPA